MKAYITLLSTDKYLDGVLALYQSLRNVGSKYPLVVGITSEISPFARDLLDKLKIECVELKDFEYNEASKKRIRSFGMPHWQQTGCKLRIFGLTDFEKLVFLDSDMLVIKNIDHLFNKPAFTAAVDSPMIAEEDFEKHRQLNSGLIVIEPSKEVENKLIEISQTLAGADQDIIRKYCSDWVERKELHLPVYYNFFVPFYKQYKTRSVPLAEVKVLHYIGVKKPFMKNCYVKEKDFILQYFDELYRVAIRDAISQIEKIDK